MPRLIRADTDESIELGDLIEMLETGSFDPDDESALVEWGPALKKLANNRTFLGDLVLRELKGQCAGQVAANQYSAQVILLHGRSKRFLLRANFWPALSDSVVVNSGTDPFFYDFPHDHNFSFLTVGYLGPGYWSDYYEYDYSRVLGLPGEKVELRFIERSQLSEGKVLLYRKHVDVHRQLPPESMSVSLNILAISAASELHDQYRFDLDRSEIVNRVNRSALEPLLRLSAHLGGDNGRDLIEDFAARHPSDRIRFAALQAKASLQPGLDARMAVYDEAGRAGGLVGGLAMREAVMIETHRAWLENVRTVAD
ncbi:MAG TPA: transposase [Allosphingosinicella sp.]|jgi:hypothetical protein